MTVLHATVTARLANARQRRRTGGFSVEGLHPDFVIVSFVSTLAVGDVHTNGTEGVCRCSSGRSSEPSPRRASTTPCAGSSPLTR